MGTFVAHTPVKNTNSKQHPVQVCVFHVVQFYTYCYMLDVCHFQHSVCAKLGCCSVLLPVFLLCNGGALVGAPVLSSTSQDGDCCELVAEVISSFAFTPLGFSASMGCHGARLCSTPH